ncbi:Peptidase S53 (modular protein) [Methylocella tundrae]|uniref:Peptidase S53 (Modular protein) n=1 Tax=Methylocella tundrae TaxID=227605 RepID=A0A8B6M8D2_METTU|nr:protease pro-enzyme activation domain-containing protein [Methylocella tundrae]VTZ50741.1 Peptidase S53 (modular protein) [Methylocella tundrae]
MQSARQILPGSARSVVAGARLVGKTNPAAKVDVTVVLTRKTAIPQGDLAEHALATPHERPLADPAAFAERYGASEEAIAAVRSFAARHGLIVKNVDQGRRVVELSGSASDMEQAFGTALHDYETGKCTYRGRQGPLLLPADIAPYVEAVLGLDNRPAAKPRFRSRAAQQSYYPNQLSALYNFPPGDGAGQTIALIELGGNYGSQDLQTYFAAAGLTKTPTVRTVSVVPGAPVPYGQDPGSDGEVMLDIEVVGAMAPGATIVVYFSDNTDQGFFQAASQAVHDPATTAVSISWGSPEKVWSQQSMNVWDSLGQSATLLNVPIFVAAGDHGCADEQPTDEGFDGQRHADFPGTCPNGVASCGGTSLLGGGRAKAKETVWNDGDGWATGGGVSIHFQVPPWQNGVSAEKGAALLMRGVPDVAADADPDTGVNVRSNGVDQVSGGTSAAAPQWAALAAILSQQLGRKAGFFIPLLYAHMKAGATNDVVTGNNTVFGVGGFSAKPGWDACTGLGSPNGARLLSLLGSSPLATSPVATSEPVSATTTSAPVCDEEMAAVAGAGARMGAPFDPAAAVLYGRFIAAAYAMYDADPSNLTPQQSSNFPRGYQLAAWVEMRDFIIESGDPVFYGFIAQKMDEPHQFILAIRGTSNGVEWWDDLNASILTPFKAPRCGLVGAGFARIYDTLEIVEAPASAAAVPRSLRSVGGFSQQVAALVHRRAAAAARTEIAFSPPAIAVAGHSLGAALATLYVADNARTAQIANPSLCTFASPRVGDSTFAATFNGSDLTSWRIVNVPDVVPNLPPQFLGFSHIGVLQPYNSLGKAKSSLSCWHALATYLSLVDPSLQPEPACQLEALGMAERAIASLRTAATTIAPAASVTVNVSINVGDNHKHSLISRASLS